MPELFNQAQKEVLTVYDEGQHLVETPNDVPTCGDGLLKFLMVELSDNEDCTTIEEAANRVRTAIEQLQKVQAHLESFDDTPAVRRASGMRP